MKNKNILVLRGLIHETQHGPDFIAELKKIMPEYHIEGLDIPGNGQLHNLRSFTSIKKNVQFLRDQWKKKIDYPSENILIGISLGGMIALEWSTLYPEDWNRAILINTSHGALSPLYKRFKLKNIINLLKMSLSTSVKRKQEIIYSMTVNDKYKMKKTVDLWTTIANKNPVKNSNALRQLWAAIAYRKISAKAALATHIICSRCDELVNYKCSEQISKFLQLPLIIHEATGHDPTVDAPDWLAEQIFSITHGLV